MIFQKAMASTSKQSIHSEASTSKQPPPRVFDLKNPDDVTAIHNILFCEDEVLANEDNGDENDTDTEEHVEERDGDSETDQDGESCGEEEAGEQGFYVGKDKVTKWSKKKPSSKGRRGGHNVMLRLPGTIGDARNARSPYECWRCIFSEDVIELIVKYTNVYIETIKGKFTRERDARSTDLVEFKSFIGLLYLAGVLRSNRQSLEELWGEDGFGVDFFSLAMNLKRFKFLIKCTRFDDVTTRNMRMQYDKLAAVREVFELFVTNCQKNYSAGQNITVDEKLEGFRGRCGFIQYIPSKPNKYGIKIYAAVDAKMFYTLNMEIYAGIQPQGPFIISNKPKDVVMRIVEPMHGSGRNVTCDNWFTSVELLEALKAKKMSLLGTLRKNKRQLPPEFVNTKPRAVSSTLFGFYQRSTLVSYVPKKGKNVLLISSMHNDDEVDGNSGKPQMILDYNATKSGVDVVDMMCSTYNVARNIRRWPMVIFFALLNVAGINSEVIHISNSTDPNPKSSKRRIYLKNLTTELCMEQIQRRSSQVRGIPTQLQLRLRQYQPTPQQPVEETPCHDGQRKRCSKCRHMKKVRYSKYKCVKCVTEVFCLEHARMICETCYNSAFMTIQPEPIPE